jgi:hypothetical protein
VERLIFLSSPPQGFTLALSSAIEHEKFYSSAYLVDALLKFRMVDLVTAKIALMHCRFSRTPRRALPWIESMRTIGLERDADLDFEIGRAYKQLRCVRGEKDSHFSGAGRGGVVVLGGPV